MIAKTVRKSPVIPEAGRPLEITHDSPTWDVAH
jgi:hypothetical protein